MTTKLTILILLTGIMACTSRNDRPESSRAEASAATTVGAGDTVAAEMAGLIDFAKPVARFDLPARLKEISGLTTLEGNRLGAVIDEMGVLFEIDTGTGSVVAERRFTGKGDFEAIERVGNRLFVLESKGHLQELQNWASAKPSVKKHRLDMPKKCDAEGLAYDPTGNRLLISCKEMSGKEFKDQKGIFAFDLRSNQLSSEPVFVIDEEKLSRKKEEFKPSGLAIQEGTGHLYVLSSVRKLIAVLDRQGRLIKTHDLAGTDLEQPEGLAFVAGGDLMVSSEGVNRNAVIYRYSVSRN